MKSLREEYFLRILLHLEGNVFMLWGIDSVFYVDSKEQQKIQPSALDILSRTRPSQSARFIRIDFFPKDVGSQQFWL